MAELTLIIGSGFSRPANLPLVNDIKDYFLRDNKEQILHFSSGEFKWFETANDAERNNGRLNNSFLAYGILLNVLVELFCDQAKEFNYEEFYQFVLDNTVNKVFIDNLKTISINSFDNAFPEIKKDDRFYEEYTRAIRELQIRELYSMLNHLIADLLCIRVSHEEILREYEVFLDFIKQAESIDFITLNHDCLLEYLLVNLNGCEYSDGFDCDHEVLKTLEGESINMFSGKFDKEINIIKLHGSIDTYRYEIAEEKGSFVNPIGQYLFFKTNDYYTKQSPYRHDPETGERVQRFHWYVDPNFITGTKKEGIISQAGIYNSLYKESENRIMNCKTLIIIGYSFCDEYVNKLISSAIHKSDGLKEIIHINPSINFPLDSESKKSTEYNFIDELEEHKLLD